VKTNKEIRAEKRIHPCSIMCNGIEMKGKTCIFCFVQKSGSFDSGMSEFCLL